MKIVLKLASVKDKKPTFRSSEVKCELNGKALFRIRINEEEYVNPWHLSRDGSTWYPDRKTKWNGPLPGYKGDYIYGEIVSIEPM